MLFHILIAVLKMLLNMEDKNSEMLRGNVSTLEDSVLFECMEEKFLKRSALPECAPSRSSKRAWPTKAFAAGSVLYEGFLIKPHGIN